MSFPPALVHYDSFRFIAITESGILSIYFPAYGQSSPKEEMKQETLVIFFATVLAPRRVSGT